MKNTVNKNRRGTQVLTFLVLMFVSVLGAAAQIATGGSYTLDQSVIATGGGTSTAGSYKVEMTAGQSVAGQQAAQSPYSVHAGFWNAQPLAPSAANAVVSGRVTTASGQGIRNVRISMAAGDGQLRYAVTGSFGFYRFDDVPVGQTYIMEIRSKRFRFEPSTRVITIMEDLADVSFTAEEN